LRFNAVGMSSEEKVKLIVLPICIAINPADD